MPPLPPAELCAATDMPGAAACAAVGPLPAAPSCAVAEAPGAAACADVPLMPAVALSCATADAPGAVACAVPPALTERLPWALGAPPARAEDETLPVAATRPGVSSAIERAWDIAWPTRTPPEPPAIFDTTWELLIDIAMCGVEIDRVMERALVAPPTGEDTVPVLDPAVVACVIAAVAACAGTAESVKSSVAAQAARRPRVDENCVDKSWAFVDFDMVTSRIRAFGAGALSRSCQVVGWRTVAIYHRNWAGLGASAATTGSVGMKRDANVVTARRSGDPARMSRRDKNATGSSRLARSCHAAGHGRLAGNAALLRLAGRPLWRVRRAAAVDVHRKAE